MNENEVKLLISSGSGPAECRRAVALVLQQMLKEAEQLGFEVTSVFNSTPRGDDPSSAVLTIAGKGTASFAQAWIGTIKWSCPSPFRSNHKRQNWFVGVFRLCDQDFDVFDINSSDLKFDCFRAGGPGGQHQNTTDSAVRVTHLPTGVSAVCRDGRSQHRNKARAIEKLKDVFYLSSLQKSSDEKKLSHDLHKTLERGNPVRCFKGPKFQEV